MLGVPHTQKAWPQLPAQDLYFANLQRPLVTVKEEVDFYLWLFV